MTTASDSEKRIANGAVLAAFLAAGIGSFAMGLMAIINEAGLFSAPALYGPAGGVSGRTTFAAVIWLIGWGVLHARWKGRELDTGRIFAATLVLTAFGVIFAFPPVWKLVG